MQRSSTRNYPPPPNEVLSVISHYAPSEARFYRLRDLHSGALLPGEGRAARVCTDARVDYPGDVSVGTYQILYYREAFDLGSVVPPTEGQQVPTVVMGGDGVVMTPADWWRSEEAKNQHLERRDLSIRRETALTRTIEGLAASLIESNAALTDNQVAINKLQVEMFGLMRELMAQSKSATDAQGDALVNASKKIAEAVNTMKTDNVASVGVEFVKQAGTILQTFAANSGNRGNGGLRDGKPRILDQEPAVAKLPAAEKPRAKSPEDPPPPPPPPPAPPAPSVAPAQSRALPTEIVIQWDDLFPARDEANPSEALVAPDPIDRTTDGPATDQEPAQETALALAPGALPDFSAFLALIGLRAPVVRPAASEWSPAWAVRRIKERFASLSDVSIACIASSWQNALSYLRELADIARPPDPALLAEEGSP